MSRTLSPFLVLSVSSTFSAAIWSLSPCSCSFLLLHFPLLLVSYVLESSGWVFSIGFLKTLLHFTTWIYLRGIKCMICTTLFDWSRIPSSSTSLLSLLLSFHLKLHIGPSRLDFINLNSISMVSTSTPAIPHVSCILLDLVREVRKKIQATWRHRTPTVSYQKFTFWERYS